VDCSGNPFDPKPIVDDQKSAVSTAFQTASTFCTHEAKQQEVNDYEPLPLTDETPSCLLSSSLLDLCRFNVQSEGCCSDETPSSLLSSSLLDFCTFDVQSEGCCSDKANKVWEAQPKMVATVHTGF
jgi:hypothetical protein